MTTSLAFVGERFREHRKVLPTRYYHFKEQQAHYLKLLHVGEGFMPGEVVRFKAVCEDSEAILATESSTKVYPSSDKPAALVQHYTIKNGGNLQIINDALILHKEAAFAQGVSLNAEGSGCFFFADMMARGREGETHAFRRYQIKNRVAVNGTPSYLEQYDVDGEGAKRHMALYGSEKVWARILMRVPDSEFAFRAYKGAGIHYFDRSHDGQIILGALVEDDNIALTRAVHRCWEIYRQLFDKPPFDLGKNL